MSDRRRPLLVARRTWLTSAAAGAAALPWALGAGPARAARVVDVRVWPSRDYTRVTLELDEALDFNHFTIDKPDRVVVDLRGIALDQAFRDLMARIAPSDPYIRQVRVGQFDRETMRLVFDVKQPVKPQLFTLDPIDSYRYRLVIDLYPSQPPDPLDVLIAQTEAAAVMRELQRVVPPAGNASDEPAPVERKGGRKPPKPIVSRLVTIAIDPGHGGEDPGAIGRRGTREKDVVLAIATRLQKRIAAEPNMRAFLTRDADYYVPLSTRVSKARAVQADLFLSIHADAVVGSHARGSSVFVLSDRGASSVEARWLASRENRADRVGGVNLRVRNREAVQLLLQMFTQSQIRESKRLGTAVLSELGDIGELHKPRVEQAGFAVLKSPDIPSILIETAFISNPDEENKLRDTRFQDRMATALMTGIRNYFIKHPPGPRGRNT
ncbi:MAG: N-acetylmuramoyl-L-alanine amidase [Burkholderiaceae bacterium]